MRPKLPGSPEGGNVLQCSRVDVAGKSLRAAAEAAADVGDTRSWRRGWLRLFGAVVGSRHDIIHDETHCTNDCKTQKDGESAQGFPF